MPLQIIPSIDLRAGQVVRLKQGDFARQINYDLDPVATARGFADAGATLMHVVDLDGAEDPARRQLELISRVIAEAGIAVQVGGGVREKDDVRRLLDAGASRVVVGTRAVEDWEWFTSLGVDDGLADRLVLAVDGKDGQVFTRGWRHDAGVSAVDLAGRCEDWGLAALLYTEISRDGMMTGVGLGPTLDLAGATGTPVLASGGVGTLEHLKPLVGSAVAGVVVGRSLHEGTLGLSDAIRATRIP